MKKSVKILIGVIITLIILWGIIFTFDFFRCRNFKTPIFVVAGKTANDAGNGTYYGLGYKVNVERSFSLEYGIQLEKIEMYFLNKFIAGAVAETENYKAQFELTVNKNNKKNIEKITVGELKNKYDYNIYYYGLDSVIIKINNEELDLKEALLNNKITMEEIIEQAKSDKKNGIIKSAMYTDGGSMKYYYDDYTIIKSNSLDGNKDVYIGISEMNLNAVR